jgi:hypothetical protein
MPIEVDCPTCGQRHNVPYTQAGKTQACAACGKPMRVPAPRAMVASKTEHQRTELITPDDLFEWAYQRVTSRLKWLISRPLRLVVLMILLIAAYLGIAAAKWALRDVGKPAPTAAAQPVDPEPWEGVGMSDTNGRVRVSAEGTTFERVALHVASGGTTKTIKGFLIITLKIENLSPNEELRYSGWSARSAAIDQAATLKDDRDVVVKQFDEFVGTEQIVGQIQSASIQPAGSTKEVLVFQRARPSTRYLKLSLPAKAYGGTGELRIKIPQTPDYD